MSHSFAYNPLDEALPPLFEQADDKFDLEQMRELDDERWSARCTSVARDDLISQAPTTISSQAGQEAACARPRENWEEERPLSAGLSARCGHSSETLSLQRPQRLNKGQTPHTQAFHHASKASAQQAPGIHNEQQQVLHLQENRGNSILSRRASTPAQSSLPHPSLHSARHTSSIQQHQQAPSSVRQTHKAKTTASRPQSVTMEFSHSYQGNGYAGHPQQLMSPASISDDADSTGFWSVAASPMYPTFARDHLSSPVTTKMQRSQSTPYGNGAYSQSLPGGFFDNYGLGQMGDLCEDPLQHFATVNNDVYGAATGYVMPRGRPSGYRHQSESGQGGQHPAQYMQQSSHLARPAGVMQRKRKPAALNTSLAPSAFPASCRTAPLERPVERPEFPSKRSFEEYESIITFEASPITQQVSTPMSKRSRSAFNTPGSNTSADYYEDSSSLSPEMLWMPACEPTDVQGLGLAGQLHSYLVSPGLQEDFLTSPSLDAAFVAPDYLHNGFAMPQAPISPSHTSQSKQRFVHAPQVPSSPTNSRHTFESPQRPRTVPYSVQGSPLSTKRSGNRRDSFPSARGGIPNGAAKELSFRNFTAKDKRVILSGVAPSGSAKKSVSAKESENGSILKVEA